jgi:PadR family transcriptional regulator, regulatory protein PadR
LPRAGGALSHSVASIHHAQCHCQSISCRVARQTRDRLSIWRSIARRAEAPDLTTPAKLRETTDAAWWRRRFRLCSRLFATVATGCHGWFARDPGPVRHAHHDTLTIYNYIVDNRGMGKPTDLVQGTLDLLILRSLANEPKHGWAIAKRIQQISNEVLQVQQGSLYPALHRLEQQGWIAAKWAESETGRQAKFYRLTSGGRKQLEKETANWKRLSQAINLVVSEG